MSGFMQNLQQSAPTLVVKLLQRRLLDKNAEITIDEILNAHQELDEKMAYLQYRMESIQDYQLVLKKLIEKKDLYIPHYKDFK